MSATSEQLVQVELTPDELRYVISAGPALAQHIPEKSLPTYCHFTKQEIIDFSVRMRQRLDDLPALATHLAERVRPGHPVTFTEAALVALSEYSWPGNIRELANLVERLSILSGPLIDASAVREVLRGGNSSAPVNQPSAVLGRSLTDALDEYERELITAALTQAQGNMAEAARILQTDRANLYRRMRRLGVEKSAEVEL